MRRPLPLVEVTGRFVRDYLIPPLVGLSDPAARLLKLLLSYDWTTEEGADVRKGWISPGNKRLADDLCWSLAKVKRYLQELENRLYILRSRKCRGYGKSDYRFIFINYEKLWVGHEYMIFLRLHPDEATDPSLWLETEQRMKEADQSFLERIRQHGYLDGLRESKFARFSAQAKDRRLCSEPPSEVEGSDLWPSSQGPHIPEIPNGTAVPRLISQGEIDEVHTINRYPSYNSGALNAHHTCSLNSNQNHSCPTTSRAVRTQLAVAIKGTLSAYGVRGEAFESATAIALRYCLQVGIEDPEEAILMVENALEHTLDEGFDSEVWVEEFAHAVAEETGFWA